MKPVRKAMLIGMAIVIVGSIGLSVFWLLRCPNYSLYATAGSFPSRDAAIKASIIKLSKECKRCPKVHHYRINCSVESNGVIVARSTTLYTRTKIGLEEDPESGFRAPYIWECHDDNLIHSAAARGEGFEAFAGTNFVERTQK